MKTTMPSHSKPARRRRRRLPAGMTTDWDESDIENSRSFARFVNNTEELNNKISKRSTKMQCEKLSLENVKSYFGQSNEDIAEECYKAYEFLERSVRDGSDIEEYDFDLFFGGVLNKMVLHVLNSGCTVNWNIISQLMKRNSTKRNICPYPPAEDPMVMSMETSIIRMFYIIVSNPARRHRYNYYLN